MSPAVFAQSIVSPLLKQDDASGSTAPAATIGEAVPAVAIQKFDDWYFRCAPSGQQSRTCEIAQVAQVRREGALTC